MSRDHLSRVLGTLVGWSCVVGLSALLGLSINDHPNPLIWLPVVATLLLGFGALATGRISLHRPVLLVSRGFSVAAAGTVVAAFLTLKSGADCSGYGDHLDTGYHVAVVAMALGWAGSVTAGIVKLRRGAGGAELAASLGTIVLSLLVVLLVIGVAMGDSC